MSNDPSSGDQPGWQGQQPYPGYGQQRSEQPSYGAASYPPPGQQQPGYGQAQPSWAQPGAPAGSGWQGGSSAPGGYPAGVGPTGIGPQSGAGGTFSALFDFSFNTFATPVVIKVLYILGLAAIALGYVFFVISAFTQGAGYGLLVLILGAVGALFYVIFFRVLLEFYFAIVRMSEDIRALRDRS
jgi:hypothetical protein